MEQLIEDLNWQSTERYQTVVAADFSEIYQYMHEGLERSELARSVLTGPGLTTTLLPGTVHEILSLLQRTIEHRLIGPVLTPSARRAMDQFATATESDADFGDILDRYRQLEPHLRLILEAAALGGAAPSHEPWERLLSLMDQETGGARPLGAVIDWGCMKPDSSAYEISLKELWRIRPGRRASNRVDGVNFGVAWSANAFEAGRVVEEGRNWLSLFCEGHLTREAYQHTLLRCEGSQRMGRMLRSGAYFQAMSRVSRLGSPPKQRAYVTEGARQSSLILNNLLLAFPQLENVPGIFGLGSKSWGGEELEALAALPRDVFRVAMEYERDYVGPLFEPERKSEAISDEERARAVYELLKDKPVEEVLAKLKVTGPQRLDATLFREVVGVLRYFADEGFPDVSEVEVLPLRRELDLLRDQLLVGAQLSASAAVREDFPLPIKDKASLSVEKVLAVAMTVIAEFKCLVENRGLWELLWDGDRPHGERVSQKLFLAVAESYCKAHGLDITPEAGTGSGVVDFKFSRGYDSRVLVEMKLSTNPRLLAGYENQIERYIAAERGARGVYLVVDVGAMGKKAEKLLAARNRRTLAGEPSPGICFVDANARPSASKNGH